jgi:hypothetical protein
MCRDIVLHIIATVNPNKKVDFDVDFDDEKSRQRGAEQKGIQ